MADLVADDRYAWAVRDTFISVAGCITVVRGLDAPDVIRGFGGDPSGPSIAVDHDEPPYDGRSVLAGRLGDAVLVAEYNGFEGSRPEVLRRVSAGGRAASVFWNVNAVTRFGFAEGGVVVTEFEPMFPEQRWGGDPNRFAAQIAVLPFDDAHLQSALLLAEEVMGLAVALADVRALDRAWPIVSQLQDLYPVPAECHSLRYDDAALVEAIGRATPQVQRAIASEMAAWAARSTGFDSEPEVAAALAAINAVPGEPLSDGAAEVVRRTLHLRRFPGISNAAETLRVAVNPDPLTAALDAIAAARYAVGDSAAVLAQALALTTDPPVSPL